MSIYDFPKIKPPKLKISRFFKKKLFWPAILIIFLSSVFGFLAGMLSGSIFYSEIISRFSGLDIEIPEKTEMVERGVETEESEEEYFLQTAEEEAVIKAVEDIWPAVVSIVITKDVPVIEQYFYDPFEDIFEFQVPQYREEGTERKEVGGGTGFIISEDGLILTNRHVVADEEADYTVFTNDGKNYSAKIVARNPVLDIAILKIEQKTSEPFSVVRLGNSDELRPGQTVIAIGTALREFRNTVSKGVVSGLGRTITAFGGGVIETLEDVIQTDAAINFGNSGGPLLNLRGEVIGINTAVFWGAQNIGFAIPINQVKKSIEQVKTLGKIVYPFLGVRHIPVNEEIQRENNLPVDYGSWIIKGSRGEPAVYPDSAAQRAGLKENDIILEFNGEKITIENSLAKIIMKHDPGDRVILKILRNGEEKKVEAILEARSE